MANVKFERAPDLGGWVIGLALGVVTFAMLKVVGEWNYMPAAFWGGVVGMLLGAVMGWPLPAGPIVQSGGDKA